MGAGMLRYAGMTKPRGGTWILRHRSCRMPADAGNSAHNAAVRHPDQARSDGERGGNAAREANTQVVIHSLGVVDASASVSEASVIISCDAR